MSVLSLSYTSPTAKVSTLATAKLSPLSGMFVLISQSTPFTTHDTVHLQQGKQAIVATKQPRLQFVAEEPLAGNLKGLRRLGIGDSRIVYQIEENRAVIWTTFHRKDIDGEVGSPDEK